MEQFNIYNDIMARTNGDIYIGVVGPVRTGKSTFIKRFMDLLVLPNIENQNSKERAKDEMPQSATGKTIMTTEPKFIPKENVSISISDDIKFNVRLIDCVGYMVEGASGHIENDRERMVKTPWFDAEIPFTKAAEIGTKKVINDHSTIGIVITCDGSFGDIPRENYIAAESKTIEELKDLGKPFVVLLNSEKPYSESTIALADELSQAYETTVMPVNCEQLRKDDVNNVMESVLKEFPVTEVHFNIPKWVQMLDHTHPIKQDIIENVQKIMSDVTLIKDVNQQKFACDSDCINSIRLDEIQMNNGTVHVSINLHDSYYYKVLTELIGTEIEDEYSFIQNLKELSQMKIEYAKVSKALQDVKQKGYGVVTPLQEEIKLKDPEIIKHGSKYGVKIKADSPSIHMIKANIETEVAPIVGTEQQAEDLIRYIKEEAQNNEGGIWGTNIFGKSLEQLINEGIQNKVYKMTNESQIKLQDTLDKVINDGNGGLVCIII